MKKSIRSFLGGAVCFVLSYGVLWVAGWLIERSFDSAFGRSNIVAVNDTPAPNQTYTTTTFTDTGGGAAGWCYRVVTVRKMIQAFDPDRNRVLNTQCDSAVEVAWKDESNLLITVSTPASSLSISQKSWSDDKAVRIWYERH
jgi:hypothetical protein